MPLARISAGPFGLLTADPDGRRSGSRRAMAILPLLAAVILLLSSGALALEAGPQDVYLRVVDVGSGLCVVAKLPGGHHVVYDAGHWVGKQCVEAVREIVQGEAIDLLMLSHSDSDHLGDVPDILHDYHVRQIIRAGYPRWDTATWRAANEAIANEVQFDEATVINLRSVDLAPGTVFRLGEATVTIVGGWREWTEPGPTASERQNAVSLVVRLDYRGSSVLLPGDTVGRRKTDDDAACKDAEKRMVDNHAAGIVSLRATVLLAPHHGGNNGSSRCFIEAVDPRYVIFSAGHQHGHPTGAAAERYLAHGIPLARIFRTDRGDDEADPDEWKEGRIPGCVDGRGDDDVEIVLRQDGTTEVAYRLPQAGC